MQHKTRGIVLHSSPYSDRFAITLIYTEHFGRISYLTVRTANRRSKIPKSLFYPFSPLELVVEHLNLRDIQRIREAKAHLPLVAIPTNPVKNAIVLFLAELFAKVIREEHPNAELFEFLLQSVKILELTDKSCANFHLAFMIGLTRYLGFFPDDSDMPQDAFFDLQDGHFTQIKPAHPHFLNPDDSRIFARLVRMNYGNMQAFRFTGAERKTIIERILDYYRLHLANFPEIKSLNVLHEVFKV
jgi:DNA repair protein RecO (recombination protein O)